MFTSENKTLVEQRFDSVYIKFPNNRRFEIKETNRGTRSYNGTAKPTEYAALIKAVENVPMEDNMFEFCTKNIETLEKIVGL